jgi:hypothetical protein
VSLKLQHYRKLAKELGILEIEEKVDASSTVPIGKYEQLHQCYVNAYKELQSLRTDLNKLIKHWKTDSPRRRLKTVNEALKHVVDNLHTVVHRGREFVAYKGPDSE